MFCSLLHHLVMFVEHLFVYLWFKVAQNAFNCEAHALAKVLTTLGRVGQLRYRSLCSVCFAWDCLGGN